MDNKEVAKQLLRVAKELTAVEINEETIKQDVIKHTKSAHGLLVDASKRLRLAYFALDPKDRKNLKLADVAVKSVVDALDKTRRLMTGVSSKRTRGAKK